MFLHSTKYPKHLILIVFVVNNIFTYYSIIIMSICTHSEHYRVSSISLLFLSQNIKSIGTYVQVHLYVLYFVSQSKGINLKSSAYASHRS